MCEDEASRQKDVILKLLSGDVTSRYVVRAQTPLEVPWPINTTAMANSTVQGEDYGAAYSSEIFENILRHESLNATLHGVADSLTSMMQNLSTNSVAGQVGNVTAFVQVQWAWTIYPTTVFAMGIGLVLHTIRQAGREQTQVGKNSSLAVMYHGLQDVNENTSLRTMDLAGIEQAAKKILVKFEGTALNRV